MATTDHWLTRGYFGTVVAIGLLASVWVASSTWERVKTKPEERTIRVTGSAKKRIVSDLIQWSATIEVENSDRSAAYRELRSHAGQTVAYLTKMGVEEDAIRVSSASVRRLFETEYIGAGDERIEREIDKGFMLTQEIVVSSHDVATVEKASREVTSLLEAGISIESGTPQYIYTKLGELKVEMLAAASADARARADHIVEAAGGDEISRLLGADMGIININRPNSRESSWDGNNDTSSVEKDIITIVHATFELDD
jgi:hypothetical protein